MLKYLSPTSLTLFYRNIEEFYTKYISEIKGSKTPQTKQMAVGSAFDAFVKEHIHRCIFGESKDFFESQVEEQNRDEARLTGKYVFDFYKASGALLHLMTEISAGTDLHMEYTITDGVSIRKQVSELPGSELPGSELPGSELPGSGVPFLGKPDLFFTTKAGKLFILDWKVNGYYTKASPKKGYIYISDKQSPYKDVTTMNVDGLSINISYPMDQIDFDWAQQLSIYAWVLGQPVGGDFVIGIDQIVGNNKGAFLEDGIVKPELRVANFRNYVNPMSQHMIYDSAVRAWEIIQSGHIFQDLSREESDQKCAALDMVTVDPVLKTLM